MCYRVCSLGAAPYTIQNVDIVKASETSMFNVAFPLSRDASVSLKEDASSPCLPHRLGCPSRRNFHFLFQFNETPSLRKVVKRSHDISSINNSALRTRPQPSSCLHLLGRQMCPSSSEPSPRHLRAPPHSSSLVAFFFFFF